MSDEGGERRREEERPPAPGGRYSLFVGLALIALVAVATLNTLGGEEGGILGADPDERGTPLPAFAVPKLLGETEGDANVFADDCETSANPCPPEERRTPACEVELPQVIRVCDRFDRPLAISFWFMRGGDCLPTQDVFDRVARRFRGEVGFLSVNVRDDRAEARETVAERGWTVPVGYDADGAVSNLYRVGVCPTVALALPGGLLHEARVGSEELSEAELSAAVERLVAESERRAATPR